MGSEMCIRDSWKTGRGVCKASSGDIEGAPGMAGANGMGSRGNVRTCCRRGVAAGLVPRAFRFTRRSAHCAARKRIGLADRLHEPQSYGVSAPQPWLVSRSRRFRRARLSPDFAFSAWKAASPFCRLLSLRSSRGSGLTQRRQRSPRCLSRSVKPRSDRPPAEAPFFKIRLA